MNRDNVDDFDTTGDDLYQIAVEILDLFNFLEGHPGDSADDMMALIVDRDYPFYDSVREGFAELVDNPGWHYVDPGDELIALELIASDDATATFRIVHQRGEQEIADAAGSIVKTYDPSVLRATPLTIKRGSDGRWRLADTEPSEAASPDEIASMVPIQWKPRRS